MPKKNYVWHWGCRPRTTGAKGSDARRDLAVHVGLKSACRAFALNRGFVYRDRARHECIVSAQVCRVRPRPPLAFSSAEQDRLLGVLDSKRFADVAPATVYATLLV